MLRILSLSAVFIVLVLLISAPASAQGLTVEIEKVIDGNTIQAWMWSKLETVRLIGIAAPTDPKQAQAATDFLKKLISEGSKVILEFDVQERDEDGRLLAYVLVYWHFRGDEKYMVKSNGPKNLINAYIVHEGHATLTSIPPNGKYAKAFRRVYEGGKGDLKVFKPGLNHLKF